MAIKTTKEFKKIQVPFLIEKGNLTEDDQYFHFQGYASTFGNSDRSGDIITNGAFKETIREIKASGDNMPILWQHNMDMPLGIYLEFKEDKKGLFVHGRMPKNDTFVSGRVMPQMKVGSVRKLSIGFWILDHKYETIKDVTTRIISKVKLFEVSLVTIPANNEADITDIKSVSPYQDLPLAARDTEWSELDALGRVRKDTDSTEKPNSRYKKAFLLTDSNKQDVYGGYQLPFADVVDGELKAVPRAIFAVAAVLRGARGEVNILDTDREKIIANLNKYYAKMRTEFEDESIISPFQEDTKSLIKNCKKLSDMETILKNHYFSNKEAEMIISQIACLKTGDQSNCGSDQGDLDSEDIKAFQDIKSNLQTLKKELS